MLVDIILDQSSNRHFACEDVSDPAAWLTISVDEHNKDLQAEAYRILGPSWREIYGDKEGAEREAEFYLSVLYCGTEAACNAINECERIFFSDQEQDALTPAERQRYRYYFTMYRAAARHLNAPGVDSQDEEQLIELLKLSKRMQGRDERLERLDSVYNMLDSIERSIEVGA